MKNIFFKIFSLLILTLSFISCDNDDVDQIANIKLSPVVVSSTHNTIFLDSNFSSDLANTFSWSAADYGLSLEELYEVQVSTDMNFSSYKVLGQTTGSITELSVSVNQLNDAAVKAGLAPESQGSLFVRVVSSLGTNNSSKSISNVIELLVTPYERILPIVYFVGNAVAPGWNPNNNNTPLFINKSNEDEYNYTGYFENPDGDTDNGRFKIIEELGNWQPQWGVTESEGSDTPSTEGGIAGNPETQAGDPGRFGVTSSGYYTFKINFKDKTYELLPLDEDIDTTANTSLGIVGSAVPGSSVTTDVDLIQSTFDPHLWKTTVNLNVGEFYFRANDSDTKKWSSSESQTGIGAQDGDMIPILVSGSYTIWFTDLDGRYLLIRN